MTAKEYLPSFLTSGPPNGTKTLTALTPTVVTQLLDARRDTDQDQAPTLPMLTMEPARPLAKDRTDIEELQAAEGNVISADWNADLI